MSLVIAELPEPAPALQPLAQAELEKETAPEQAEKTEKEQAAEEPAQRRSMKRRISLADVEMYLRPFDWFGSLRAKIKHKKILSRLRPAKKQKKVRFRFVRCGLLAFAVVGLGC